MKLGSLVILASATVALAAPGFGASRDRKPSLADAVIARIPLSPVAAGQLGTRQIPTCADGEQCRSGAAVHEGGYTQVNGAIKLPDLPRRTVGYSYALIAIGCNEAPIAVVVRFIPPGDLGVTTYDIFAVGPSDSWQNITQALDDPNPVRPDDVIHVGITAPTPVTSGFVRVENTRTGVAQQVFMPAGQHCQDEAAWLFYDQMASLSWFAAMTNKGGLTGAEIVNAERGGQAMSKCTLDTPTTVTCLSIGGPRRKASTS